MVHISQLQLWEAPVPARRPAKIEAETGAAVNQHMQLQGLLPQLWPLLEHRDLHHTRLRLCAVKSDDKTCAVE